MPSLDECFATRGRDSANNFLVIRLFAASLVIYGHSFFLAAQCDHCFDLAKSVVEYQSHGLALQVFFVVSGFLVTASFDHRRSLVSFATSRTLRIFPALFVCVSLLSFATGPLITSLPLAAYLFLA
jgi:peptidoglycan/LPS O-acetylase OafA/YrhL